MKLLKVWHPYTEWEDYLNGMWASVHGKKRKMLLRKAYELAKNHDLFGEYMKRVANEWRVSSEHNLTNVSSNRRAWIGQAACALAFKCPEDVTRQAWGYLTDFEQEKANHVADLVIVEWEKNYVRKNLQLH